MFIFCVLRSYYDEFIYVNVECVLDFGVEWHPME